MVLDSLKSELLRVSVSMYSVYSQLPDDNFVFSPIELTYAAKFESSELEIFICKMRLGFI